MKFQIAPLRPDDLGAVARFSALTWARPHDMDFLTWRYIAPQSFHETILAWSGGECVGMLCAFRMTGILDGKRFPFLSIFDWFCRPDLRGQGIGGALSRTLMRGSTPILGYGGTADAQARHPKIGFQVIAEAGDYVLPLGASHLARGAARKLRLPESWVRAPAAIGCRIWFRRGLSTRAAGAEENLVSIPDEKVEEACGRVSGPELVVLPDPALIRWLRAGPKGLGEYEAIGHVSEDSVRDWIRIRRYSVGGEARADLVDMSPPPGPRDDSLIAAAVARLAASGVQLIRAQATSPDVQQDLRRNRFVRRTVFPIFWWSPVGEYPQAPVHLMASCSDDMYLPFPGPG